MEFHPEWSGGRRHSRDLQKSSTGVPPVLFVAFTAETVEAVVTPELEGVYQWTWLNNGAVSAPAARVINISWALDYPGQPECDHGSTTTQYPESAGRPLAVNNDDDDGDGVLDLYDIDDVSGDDDFIKIYPFSPYTGGCCLCPSHNQSASTRATRISCSENLSTWGDAAKTTQCTSADRGKAVYVEGIRASTYIGGDKIIWGWSEDGETYARTNTYIIFSLRMFGDLNFDNTIDAADYAAASSLSEYGWVMPVASNTLRKVELKTDLLIPGHLILSLTGSAQIRVWTTATPSVNDTPLLVTGQTITNGVDGANFGTYPVSTLYVEAISSGSAALAYSYVGTGSADGYEYGAKLEVCSSNPNGIYCVGKAGNRSISS